MMDRWSAGRIAALAARADINISVVPASVGSNTTMNSTMMNATMYSVPWTVQNTTLALIAALGAFSLVSMLLTIHRILLDATRAGALSAPRDRQRFRALRNIHAAEAFPFALSCGTAVQQIVFIAVQATSVGSLLSGNCRSLAMVTYPAIFLGGFITFVFGLEMALRGAKQQRFLPRKRWNTTICLAIISFFSLLSWLPTIIWPMFHVCVGSLIGFVMRYELISLVVLSVLVGSFIGLAAFLGIQLKRTTGVDLDERIAASRMCCYLLLSALIYTLVIPNQVQMHRRAFSDVLTTSRIAEASLFSSGIVIAIFHLFLRANANRMIIQPTSEIKSKPKQKRARIRFFGPSDLEMNISGPLALQGRPSLDSRSGLVDVGPEKTRVDFDVGYFERPNRAPTPNSELSQAVVDPTNWPLPPDPKTSDTHQHKRAKSSYSLFPTRAEDIPRLPPTVYTTPKRPADNKTFSRLALRRQTRQGSVDGNHKSVTDVGEAFGFLMRPPALFAGRQHDRKGSGDSVATVQIGLRFSIAPATLAAGRATRTEPFEPSGLGAPPLQREETDSSAESLGLPIQSPTANASTPGLPSARLSSFPPPPPTPAAEPPSPQSVYPSGVPSLAPALYLETQRQKILPAVPAIITTALPSTSNDVTDSFSQAHLSPNATLTPVPFPTEALSGLRMNPISPFVSPTRSPSSTRSARSPVTAPTPTQPSSATRLDSPTQWPTVPAPAVPPTEESKKSPVRSPTAKIPLGAGTMARSPPGKGWI